VAAERSQAQIRADIDKARDQLASAVDQLADRLAPKRLAAEAQVAAKEKVNSPTGKKVIGGIVVLVAVIAIRNYRKSKR
jgi:F0F1-type ATP synthase membrane subunit b/b'